MVNLKFADTHNVVAFLSKPEESDGFEQIVDFLNARPIKYALIVYPTIYISCIEQFWSTVNAKTINGEVQLHALVDGKKIIIIKSTVRRDLQLEDAEGVDFQRLLHGMSLVVPQPSNPTQSVANEAVQKELGDSLVRVATTASSLEAEHDSGNITKTQSKATPNESSSLGTTSCGGPRCQETIGDTIDQTRFENVSKHLNDSLLAREKTKTTQANEIASLKRRVKKLEKKYRSRTHKLKRLYKVGLTARVESSGDKESLGEDASKQGRINAIDADEEITLVSVQDDADKEMFDMDALNVSTAAITVTITTEEITLAQALEALKTSKPKVKGIFFKSQPMKKKDLIRLDEEVALKLQAKFDEEERLAREKAEKE
ncbi:hypothetical protein Tco_0930851 [Tanacetum coccineum]